MHNLLLGMLRVCRPGPSMTAAGRQRSFSSLSPRRSAIVSPWLEGNNSGNLGRADRMDAFGSAAWWFGSAGQNHSRQFFTTNTTTKMTKKPTVLPPRERQIELARTAKQKLEECGVDGRLSSLTLTDWSAFFAHTGLDENTLTPMDEAQLTLMLSYPLTLAWLIQEQQRAAKEAAAQAAAAASVVAAKPDSASTAPADRTSTVRKVQIIGARAEASLPTWVWQLVSNLTSSDNLNIQLIGPMVPDQTSKELENITISFVGHMLYHDAVSKGKVDTIDADAFFCFHPGWGQNEWKNSWRPSLDLLFAAKAPVYFTSFSDDDVRDDYVFARQQLRQLIKASNNNAIVLKKKHKKSLWSGKNPFRSKVLIPLNTSPTDEGKTSESKSLIAVNSRVSMVASSS